MACSPAVSPDTTNSALRLATDASMSEARLATRASAVAASSGGTHSEGSSKPCRSTTAISWHPASRTA
jgi:hypothetical protein